MKKETAFVLAFLTLLCAIAFVSVSRNEQRGEISATQASAHIADEALYPNEKTPGAWATLDPIELNSKYTEGCIDKSPCTYSQAHRSVTQAVRKQVFDEYEVPAEKRNIANGEIDHFYPLCGGGSNNLSNLWYQPLHGGVTINGIEFGYKQKDALETWVCLQIKGGKLKPQEAFDKMTTDWVAFYFDVFGKSALGSVEQTDYDGDD